jgi:hypothetical protein
MQLEFNHNHARTAWQEDLAAREGLVKFDRDTPLEQFLFRAGCFGIVAALVMLQAGTMGGRRAKPQPAVLPYVPLAVLVSLLCFAARYFTDNYCLVDPKQHLVHYHFKFLWFRTVGLLLKREDILAVATRGRARSNRTSTWWEYQVLDKQGTLEGVFGPWLTPAVDLLTSQPARSSPSGWPGCKG